MLAGGKLFKDGELKFTADLSSLTSSHIFNLFSVWVQSTPKLLNSSDLLELLATHTSTSWSWQRCCSPSTELKFKVMSWSNCSCSERSCCRWWTCCPLLSLLCRFFRDSSFHIHSSLGGTNLGLSTLASSIPRTLCE